MYRAASDAGVLRQSKHRPQSFEMTEQAQILAALFQLMQQHIHVSSGSRKKSKAKPWPTPETAAEIVKREDADRGYEELMNEIVFMPREQFDAHIAEHRGKQAAVRRGDGVTSVSEVDPVSSLHDDDRTWLDAHAPGWEQPTE